MGGVIEPGALPDGWLFVASAAAALGLLAGVLIEWLFSRSRERRLTETVERLTAETTHQQELKAEREAMLERAGSELKSVFGELANRTLKSNSETFLRLAEQNLGAQQARARGELSERERAVENLVKPIREALSKTEQQIGELEKARREAYGSIRAQLETMQQNQEALQTETRNLVNALRRPEVRGQWGEMTLRRLAELAGMVEHCDFVEQEHTRSGEAAIRPDMIVRMPDNRELVVDVKTPLDAYLEAIEAGNDADRKAALQRHARKVSERIRELSSKQYWSQFPKSPEFVILFIPGDQFLSAALNERPNLIDDALRQKIILATPTSLVALLKAVAYGWRQLALADNAEEIRRLAEDLYDRLAVFGNHLNRIGRQLDGSVKAYNSAVGSLERNVLPGARKFVELGIKGKKAIPDTEPVDALTRVATGSEAGGAEPLPSADAKPTDDQPPKLEH
ncbi:MAG: DNA recombination protein RmuC [Pseudomonadota bacterium]